MITENSEALIEILNHLSESVQVCDESGKIVYCNNRTCEITGYTKSEILSMNISDIEISFKTPQSWENHFSLIQSGSVLINRGLHKTRSGALIPVEASVKKLILGDKKLALAIIRDISDEIKSENRQLILMEILRTAAKISEYLLNYDNTQNSVHYALESLGKTVFVDRVYIFENHLDEESNEIYSTLKHEWVQEGISEQINNPMLKNFPFQSGFSSLFESLNSGENINTDIKDMPDDIRSEFEAQEIISLLLIPIRIKDRFWGMIGFDSCTSRRTWRQDEISFLKITANMMGMFIENRESLKVLENLVEEKEILLSELHHRTKNNLAIISGIIDLQNATSNSLELIKYSDTIRQRIQNIALIHEILSSTGKFSHLSFPSYINLLINRLEESILDGKKLTRIFTIDNFVISDLSQMVSMGILLNEILLNSFKHAFLHVPNPELTIEVNHSEDQVIIRIKDNGPGFTPDNDPSMNGSKIGMMIIKGLLDQLKATLELTIKNGTDYNITIPKLKTN
jgi:PAS domain S-box-containing protein